MYNLNISIFYKQIIFMQYVVSSSLFLRNGRMVTVKALLS